MMTFAFAFRNGLLRDVIYSMMFYAQRRYLHWHMVRIVALKLRRKLRGPLLPLPTAGNGNGNGNGKQDNTPPALTDDIWDMDPDLAKEIEQELKNEGFEETMDDDEKDMMFNADLDAEGEEEENENLHGMLQALKRHRRLSKIGQRDNEEDEKNETRDRSRHSSTSKVRSNNPRAPTLVAVQEGDGPGHLRSQRSRGNLRKHASGRGSDSDDESRHSCWKCCFGFCGGPHDSVEPMSTFHSRLPCGVSF